MQLKNSFMCPNMVFPSAKREWTKIPEARGYKECVWLGGRPRAALPFGNGSASLPICAPRSLQDSSSPTVRLPLSVTSLPTQFLPPAEPASFEVSVAATPKLLLQMSCYTQIPGLLLAAKSTALQQENKGSCSPEPLRFRFRPAASGSCGLSPRSRSSCCAGHLHVSQQ